MLRALAFAIGLTAALTVAAPPADAQSKNEIIRQLGPMKGLTRGLAPRPYIAPGAGGAPPAEMARPAPPPGAMSFALEFEFNSDQLTADAKATLDRLAEALNDPQLKPLRFLIVGHTDARGAPKANLDLSERRAFSVKVYLVETGGVETSRLEIEGVGQKRPADPSDPMSPRNRRVEIVTITN